MGDPEEGPGLRPARVSVMLQFSGQLRGRRATALRRVV